MVETCPSREQLLAFDAGTLLDDSFATIAQHLDTCAECLATLRNLSPLDESLLEGLRHQAETDPYAEEARYKLAASRFGAMLPSTLELAVNGSNLADDTGDTALYSGTGHVPQLQDLGPRYENLGVIKQGGMGVIYLAHDRVLNRDVALKMIKSAAAASIHDIERFKREAQALAKLGERRVGLASNIIEVLDFGYINGQPYFTMPIASGGSLANHLDKFKKDLTASLRLVAQVAKALQYIHDNKYVHRDLKPGNILLELTDPDCDDYTTCKPIISDFGLAKWLDRETQLTRAGEAAGTLAYMAPEQFDSSHEGPAEGREKLVDVWALGVMLYELSTGQLPFVEKTRAAFEKAICKNEPLHPSIVNKGLHVDLETIILKCLDTSPGRRYASALELAEDLERRLAGEPIKGRRESRIRRAWRFARKHPVTVTCCLLVPLMLLGLVAHRYFTDPDRPLKVAQGKLKAGESATLIADRGAPVWFRTCVGVEKTKAAPDQDGVFTVDSLSLALVELLPDPECQHFRFTAWVRHNEAFGQSAVGIYFAHKQTSKTESVQHSFCDLSFPDLGELANAKPVPKSQPKEFRSQLLLQLRQYSDGLSAPMQNEKKPTGLSKLFLSPSAEELERPWRKLVLEVSPDLLRVRWEDEWLEVSRADVLKRFTSPATIKDAEDFQPNLGPRGGIGLYVYRGSASFKLVSVDPLSD